MTASLPDIDTDIAIIGGGLVGTSLACALEAGGRAVALVEAAAFTDRQAPSSFDERNLALAAASLNALDALGILRHLRTPPAPIERIHVSRAGDFGAVRLVAADYGHAAFGGVVIARELGAALNARLGELPRLQHLVPARMSAAVRTDAGWQLTIERAGEPPQRLHARLLVAADGTGSAVRDVFGIAAARHDYRQSLVVCAVASDRPPAGQAWERFTESGPVALLPRPDGRYGAICGVAADDVDRVLALDEDGWLRYLQQRFGGRAGRFMRAGARVAYPLHKVCASALTAARGVVVGNAAQTLHPIGAQGFNLGLRDALTLADVLAGDGDPGDPARLARHAALRREDRDATLAFSDGLAQLTAMDGLPAHVLRSLGLLAVDRSAALRAPLVAGAMGFRGNVPRLARGAA